MKRVPFTAQVLGTLLGFLALVFVITSTLTLAGCDPAKKNPCMIGQKGGGDRTTTCPPGRLGALHANR